MRRPHLFLPPDLLQSGIVTIEGKPFHHIAHVLRSGPGDELILMDGQGNGLVARITRLDKRLATVAIVGQAEIPPEPSVHVTVAQALGKGDKFEQVIQHGTELGASAFIPLLTERAVRRPESKLDRWQQIAQSAAEQCGRGKIPQVHPVESLDSLVKRFAEFGSCVLLHPGEASHPMSVGETVSVLLLVGPEGGFSEREVTVAADAGAQLVTLGPYILRTETAALAALSLLLLKIV